MARRENKIAPEVAEQEYQDFLIAMDIYIDEDEMESEDKAAYLKQKRRIIQAIELGDLTFNDNGEAVYTPFKSGDIGPITFHERTGATLTASDSRKKGNDAAKMYAMVADMTKKPISQITSLRGPDIKLVEAVFTLLMD